MNTLNHIAFIMDGNGRWGLKKKKNRNFGHLKGLETVKKIVSVSLQLKIPIITFYVFSSENWSRPKQEIKFLFSLIRAYFKKEIQNIFNQGIKIKIIGRNKNLPKNINKILKDSEYMTRGNKKLLVNLAINYGSKNEIIDAIKKINVKSKKINEEIFNKYLNLKPPFPDILIRTGGQKRLSNFLLWQLAYTELFFFNKLWPDFSIQDLKNVIKKYNSIKRNFGGI